MNSTTVVMLLSGIVVGIGSFVLGIIQFYLNNRINTMSSRLDRHEVNNREDFKEIRNDREKDRDLQRECQNKCESRRDRIMEEVRRGKDN